MSEQRWFQGYIVDTQSRCLRKAHSSEEVISFDSPRSLQIRAMMVLPYENMAALESELRRGDVIELTMPHDAYAFLLLDEQGKFCFVWDDCYHRQDEEQACFPFETLEQALLWVFSRVFSHSMTRQKAQWRYGDSSDSQIGRVLSTSIAQEECPR